MSDSSGANTRQPEPRRPTPKKRYSAPRLEEYGHVAKLTQGGGSTRSEPGNPQQRACL